MLSTLEKFLLLCVSKYFHEISGIGIMAEKSRSDLGEFPLEKFTFSTKLTGHFEGVCSLNCSPETLKELAEIMFAGEGIEIDAEMVQETGKELLNTVVGRMVGQLSREDIKIKMAPPEFQEGIPIEPAPFTLHIPFKTKHGHLHFILLAPKKY